MYLTKQSAWLLGADVAQGRYPLAIGISALAGFSTEGASVGLLLLFANSISVIVVLTVRDKAQAARQPFWLRFGKFILTEQQ